MYNTKVHVWLPKNYMSGIVKWKPGHCSISIAGNYFSFSNYLNRKAVSVFDRNVSPNKWINTFDEDRKAYEKLDYLYFSIDLNFDNKLYSYILDNYNPSQYYRGMNGSSYALNKLNCCHQVASFIAVAIFPYLAMIFGDSQSNTYWLNYQDRDFALERYNVLRDFYYTYNSKIDQDSIYSSLCDLSDEEAILSNWTLFKMYVQETLHTYGSDGTRAMLRQYSDKRPDDIFWHPIRIYRYAYFAKAVIESFGSKSIHIPWVYTVEFTSRGTRYRHIPTVEEFQRQN